MLFSIQNLFFVAYTTLALVLCLVSAAISISSVKWIGRRHALLVIAIGVLTGPFFLAAAVGSLDGYGPLSLLSPFLPILCAAACYANWRNLPYQSFGTRLLTVCVCIWDLFLFGLYLLRALQTLGHFELGEVGSSLLTSLALAQTSVGGSGAELLPVFLYVPLLLPPFASEGKGTVLPCAVSGFLASFMTGLVLIYYPSAASITTAMREPTESRPLSPARNVRLSATVDAESDGKGFGLATWLAATGSTPEFEGRVTRAKDLGLRRLRVTVSADALKAPERFARIERNCAKIRELGLSMTVVTRPSPLLTKTDGIGSEAFARHMQEAHWTLAERIKPDLLVLFSQPYGEEIAGTLGRLPVAHWSRLIEDCAAAIHKGHPKLACGIELDASHDFGKELRGALTRKESGIQRILFVMDARLSSSRGLERGLLELEGSLSSGLATKGIAIVGRPPAGLGLGGEAAHVRFVERLIQFADAHKEISDLDLGPLFDSSRGLNGYFDSRDRAKPAMKRLLQLVLGLREPAPR